MNDPSPFASRRADAWTWTLRVVAAAPIGLWLAVAGIRLTFPLELEWMESGVLVQAWRWQQGLPLYPPPSAAYVPHPYPPLHGVVLAIVGWIWPLGFTSARALSNLATMATGVAIWLAVRREGKNVLHSGLALALYASAFVFCYRWFDVARPDTLALALAATGALMLRQAWGRPWLAVGSGAVLALAFWTKQTMGLLALGSLAGGLIAAPRQVIWAALTAAAGVALGLAFGWLSSDELFWYYIVTLHAEAPLNWERLLDKTWWMFVHGWSALLLALALAAYPTVRDLWLHKRRVDPERAAARRKAFEGNRGRLYWLVFAAFALLASALGYARAAAEANAFLPGALALSILGGVSVPASNDRRARVIQALTALQIAFAMCFEPMFQNVWENGLSALPRSYALQDPARTVPRAAEFERAQALRDRWQQWSSQGYRDRFGVTHQGPLLALSHPWWAVLAGGTPSVASMALHDLPPSARTGVQLEVARAVKDGEYAGIWFDGEIPKWLSSALVSTYRVEERRVGSSRVLPLVGYMSKAGMTTPYHEAQLFLVRLSARPLPPQSVVWADFDDGSTQGFAFEGSAFGRGPVASLHDPKWPIAGVGGRAALASHASASGLRAIGRATSPAYVMQAGRWRLHLLVATIGDNRGVAVHLHNREHAANVTVPSSSPSGELVEWTYDVPANWLNTRVTLVVHDNSPQAAVVIDDLWLEPIAANER